MAEYTLTLDNLKFVNVTGFVRNYGTKKQSNVNGGSLTSEEFNIANALPWDLQRPLVVTESSVLSNIQYDAKVLINGSNITITLNTATEGIMVTLMAVQAATITFNTSSASTTISDTLQAGETAKLVYIGSRWEILQDVGQIIANPSTLKPFGALTCDGTSYDPDKYPRLSNRIGVMYNLSIDSSDIFRVPDYRECALVGIGQNTTDTIAAHDEYTIGQFKDDQLQSHTHTRGTMNITGNAYWKGDAGRGFQSFDGALAATAMGSGYYADGGHPGGSSANGINLNASRNWSGATSAPSGRVGDVTRGKRKGVNYIIKY